MFIKPGLTHLVITRPDKYCWKSIFEMVIKPGTYFSDVFGRRIFTMWFALMLTRHLHIKTYPMLWRVSSATGAEFQPKAMTCPWQTALVDMPGILWWTSFVHACIGVHATSIFRGTPCSSYLFVITAIYKRYSGLTIQWSTKGDIIIYIYIYIYLLIDDLVQDCNIPLAINHRYMHDFKIYVSNHWIFYIW